MKEDKKKDVVEIPLTQEKEELRIPSVPKSEESSSSSENSKQEEEPQPQPMRRSTCEK